MLVEECGTGGGGVHTLGGVVRAESRWCSVAPPSQSHSLADRLTDICCRGARELIRPQSKMSLRLSAASHPAVSPLVFSPSPTTPPHPPTIVPLQAKRCHAGAQEEAVRQQELQGGDAGADGERPRMASPCWKLDRLSVQMTLF